ncbi:VOC family protein [Puia sp. P3]|uniref:VOC family protein n=1 Tax=Puia sp. P3 TaxID=3423952 RepID=UPI003D67A6DC
MFNYTGSFSSFSVNDLKKATEFYRQKLGLEINETPEGLSVRIGNDANVFLYPKENHEPASFTVLNFQVSNIEEAVDGLTASGITFLQYEGDLKTDKKGIFRGPVGPKIAWFTDPAGNILSVVESNN